MDSIKINTGVKRIAINDDQSRVIEFNPLDVAFAERFYSLIKDFETKQAEYQSRSAVIDADAGLDGRGIPKNIESGIALLREVCEFMRERIDHLFGAGTSQKVFGDDLVLEAFQQFFEGITPFIQSARSEKVERYTAPKRGGRVMK